MDCTATSGSLNQEMISFARQRFHEHLDETFETRGVASSMTISSVTLDAASQTEASLVTVVVTFLISLYPFFEPSKMQDALSASPFLQDVGIVWTVFDTKNVRLLPWPARFPDLLPVENIWSMVAKRLACNHTIVTIVNRPW
ncbi:hypothetical protein TNCV_796481 [Trichonephila clavipes]|uniref:Tc1-like transposase DDE domain-containing protein n=1 Tax=Trichonephila clavipes TaxID=2585209 RepID=A0A8X6WHR3_TRICX|nr:hypothetical protein TNCV_796481 [Trichonephila clavipes]